MLPWVMKVGYAARADEFMICIAVHAATNESLFDPFVVFTQAITISLRLFYFAFAY
jgi:hypothetical protein